MPFGWGKSKTHLTRDQKKIWTDNGYLVLSGFFDPQSVEAVNTIVRHAASDPASLGKVTVDVLHGQYVGKRFLAADAPREAFEGPIKINDLFLDKPEVRHLALSAELS